MLLILTGVVISSFTNGNIIGNTESAVEQSNIVAKKEEIELAIAKKIIISDRGIGREEIITQLEKDGIINAGDSNADSGQVKTQPDGYVYEIKEDANGNWEVEYIGKGEIERPEITMSLSQNTTGIANTVTITVVAKADSGIKSYTPPTGTGKTYSSGTKEISETYEVSANGTYTFTVTNNNGKTESKSIIISNILEGTIEISATPSTPTKGNVVVTITWPSGSSKGTQEIQIGEGSWQTVTGSTSQVTLSQNSTVRARVRTSSTEITANTITVTNIDKANPIVTASEGTDTIIEGESKEVSSYFTYSANGIAKITSVTYTVNGSAISNTNTLTEGTHTIICTVTKATGAVASATKNVVVESARGTAAEISSNPSEYYGGVVSNYTTPSGDSNVKWKIFYADSSNIYLIADDYIHYDYAPRSANYTLYKNSDYILSFNDVYKDYTGGANITDSRIKKWISYIDDNGSNTKNNIRAVAFMLDVDIWSAKFGNSTYAEYAIGGPTLDMFVASYNQTHSDKTIEYTHNSTGYQVKWSTDSSYNTYISGLNTSESLYVISDPSKAYTMWLAAPSAYNSYIVMYVSYDGLVYNNDYSNYYPGFRPLVCLKSDVQLEKQEEGKYIIK